MKTLLLAAAATFALATPAVAANLVVNGDFEAGFTGFSTTYTPVTPSGPGGSNMVPENTVTVGTNAANQHPLWASIAAQSGTQYLIANGSAASDASVWSQTLNNLIVGKTYLFSAFGVNVCCNSGFGGTNVAPILISAGSGLSPTTIASSGALGATGTWTQFSGSFVATGTSTNLSIFTDTTAASGNDFGLDNISVSAVPEPATWAMMILGFGVVGSAMRRRQSANLRFA